MGINKKLDKQVSRDGENCMCLHTLVRSLTQRGKRDSAVERLHALLANDGVHGVASVAVPWRLKRVGERVLLSLQTNLHDFHRRHNRNSFGSART